MIIYVLIALFDAIMSVMITSSMVFLPPRQVAVQHVQEALRAAMLALPPSSQIVK